MTILKNCLTFSIEGTCLDEDDEKYDLYIDEISCLLHPGTFLTHTPYLGSEKEFSEFNSHGQLLARYTREDFLSIHPNREQSLEDSIKKGTRIRMKG